MESETPRVSFISIVDFSEDARWLFLTESVSDLLGFEPRELIGRPALELVHPDEFPQVKQMHYDTVREDKAAALAYLRLKHKDPFKGYILCAVSRSVVHNVVVGSVSFATPGGKALQNASTAQEVEVVTPSAKNFELRRWGDPSPMSSSNTPDLSSPAACPSTNMDTSDASSDRSRGKKPTIISFNHLPSQSTRSALILDRFSIHCTVLYCSNDLLLSTTKILGRSFFDFVTSRTEHNVRSWIDVIKSWGVNDRGQPSDGGFGFGKFALLLAGRDSRGENEQDTPLSRRRFGDARINCRMPSSPRYASQSSPGTSSRSRPPSSTSSATFDQEIAVDAIFSGHSDGILLILRPASKYAFTHPCCVRCSHDVSFEYVLVRSNLEFITHSRGAFAVIIHKSRCFFTAGMFLVYIVYRNMPMCWQRFKGRLIISDMFFPLPGVYFALTERLNGAPCGHFGPDQL